MKKTSIVTYPAVFIADDADGYTVIFPDIADAVTGGRDLGESLVNATATLGRFLVDHQSNLPVASTMTQLTHRYPADFIQFVAVDLNNVATQPVETDVNVAPLGLAK
ncbi:type II toxin-antitoxin system HicB family antitoxin [Levilactobacillus zymae]|uniref:Uncharacterized protein n=1 Tax=Levilactobacillus zymae TaxID=267363 RepID=A0A1Y6JT43_9LACO|nr:hypothetical protein [Levilactobacillus zymae]KRL16427.1 hypothetical protein FD38_GL002285 [Levilactobacillus zymae DSM 19395]QFR61811.1 HicB family protein [Levilactobacillus zymae]GEO72878.1 hypothetical protein LZY01_20460 [Levilactobacillus zymae]SMS13108.1 Protein of unknown function UPF0150 [Levilactobacillus zymae]